MSEDRKSMGAPWAERMQKLGGPQEVLKRLDEAVAALDDQPDSWKQLCQWVEDADVEAEGLTKRLDAAVAEVARLTASIARLDEGQRVDSMTIHSLANQLDVALAREAGLREAATEVLKPRPYLSTCPLCGKAIAPRHPDDICRCVAYHQDPDDVCKCPLRLAVVESKERIVNADSPEWASGVLGTLRAAGWMVAVHNDYRQDDKARTFWLLTHPEGKWIKGEGHSDAFALAECMAAALKLGLLEATPAAEPKEKP